MRSDDCPFKNDDCPLKSDNFSTAKGAGTYIQFKDRAAKSSQVTDPPHYELEFSCQLWEGLRVVIFTMRGGGGREGQGDRECVRERHTDRQRERHRERREQRKRQTECER